MHDQQRTKSGFKPVDLYVKSNPGLLSGGIDVTNPREWHHSMTKSRLVTSFIDNYNKQIKDSQHPIAVYMTLPAVKSVEEGLEETDVEKLSNKKSHIHREHSLSKRGLPPLPPLKRRTKLIQDITSSDEDIKLPQVLSSNTKIKLPRLERTNKSLGSRNISLESSIQSFKHFKESGHLYDNRKEMYRQEIQSTNCQPYEEPIKVETIYKTPLPKQKHFAQISERYSELRIRRQHEIADPNIMHGDQYKLKQKSLLKLKLADKSAGEPFRDDSQKSYQMDFHNFDFETPDWSTVPSKLGNIIGTHENDSTGHIITTTGIQEIPETFEDTLYIEAQRLSPLVKGMYERKRTDDKSNETTRSNGSTHSHDKKAVGRRSHKISSWREPKQNYVNDTKVSVVSIPLTGILSPNGPSGNGNTNGVVHGEDVIRQNGTHCETDQMTVHSYSSKNSISKNKVMQEQGKSVLKSKKFEIFGNRANVNNNSNNNNVDNGIAPLYRLDITTHLDPDVVYGYCHCMLCPDCQGVRQELLHVQENKDDITEEDKLVTGNETNTIATAGLQYNQILDNGQGDSHTENDQKDESKQDADIDTPANDSQSVEGNVPISRLQLRGRLESSLPDSKQSIQEDNEQELLDKQSDNTLTDKSSNSENIHEESDLVNSLIGDILSLDKTHSKSEPEIILSNST